MKYIEKLQNARTTQDFADLLGYTASNISYLLYHYSEEKYSSFSIPKKNGKLRTINVLKKYRMKIK